MTPGTYLRLRREAAGLGVIQAAASIAAFGFSPRLASPRTAAAARINAAEADVAPFTRAEVRLLREAAFVPLDVEVYLSLVALQLDPGNPDLPRPAVCRECACSWHDACDDGGLGCHWVEEPAREADGLCSRCLRVRSIGVRAVPVSPEAVECAGVREP